MITQLATVKNRLAIAPADITHDGTLTSMIEAVSARFDKETRRTLGRSLSYKQQFRGDERCIILECYPVETVGGFELKSTEGEGWIAREPEFLLRRSSILEVLETIGTVRELGRVTYTGGYVLPGAVPGAGQTALPKDLEHAAIEQVSAWFQNKDKLGLVRHWPNAGTYIVLSLQPLLPSVSSLLKRYERWAC